MSMDRLERERELQLDIQHNESLEDHEAIEDGEKQRNLDQCAGYLSHNCWLPLDQVSACIGIEELGAMTKCNIELSAKQIWNDQEELRVNRVNFGNFVRCERYYTGLGPWHMKVRTYMQEEVITADTPYLVVQKAKATLADGWEELKLTRNGEL